MIQPGGFEMKKNIYLTILTIVTVICIIAGSCYHIIGWGISLAEKFNFPFWGDNAKISAGKLTESGDLPLDEFTSIQADVSVMDLNIVNGTDFSIRYSANQKLIPKYKVENNVLIINQTCKMSSIAGSKKCAVSITVPQELDTIDIAAAVGDIDLNGLTSSNLILKADVGDIDISDCDFGQVELDAAVGDIDFSNSSFLTMNAVNDVGDVKVDTDDLSDYQIELNTSIGEVSVNGRGSHRNFEQDGDTNRKLVIDNSTGDIELTYR